MKRPIVKYYSLSSVLALEPHMDKVIEDFCTHLDTRFIKGPDGPKDINLGEWVAFCESFLCLLSWLHQGSPSYVGRKTNHIPLLDAWDLISSVTFSHRFGYMDKGYDFDGTIAIADKALDYFATVGQIPSLDFLLDKNPIMRIGPPNLSNATRIALENLIARLQGKDPHFDPKTPDYLQHFIDSKTENPDLVDDGVIMGYLLVNILAGADTTAITIRAVFYYVLRDPDVYRKLVAEILASDLDPERPAPYNTARALPYLEAVCREAMRLHPAVAMLLERYVPETGLTLPDGSFVPGGAAVGINPYVVGRNKGVWGPDADEFRPERWLRAKDEGEETYRLRLRQMNGADLTFGGGSRVCTGRNLATLEVYKVVATLVRRYEIQLADPTREWHVTCSWFPRQEGIICKIQRRV